MKKMMVVLAALLALVGCITMMFAPDSSKLRIGMTMEEARAVLGSSPERINRTIASTGERIQWVYHWEPNRHLYVYFEDDRVTAWQD
jgi:hypothetical protein